ncbi:aminoglycoside 6'-N-acetyltransferase [Spirosoma fluviale]|uniref:Aminoglycoside N(6')-acetyltransferase type 1 n=1 Tax=Spirosoma fluviale TaxID=1597977 RepID=A0A286FIG8_9BACT|nr:aminoglycoside 6'-N-acetyltransferase [Spirosoma fluviale]SOD82584.1 aminoglycoside 6'-N-acetyltransferase I [Spirosoma fluviale]
MEIEPLSRYTLNAVVDLVLELWPDCTFDEELQNYTRLIGSENDGCYLAKAGESYMAFVHVSRRHDYVEGSVALPVAYIEGIYVKRLYRKQGVAKKLIQAAEDWAKQKGLTQIASDTEITNITSIDFHKKAGFEEVERIVCFIKDIH